MSVRGTRGCVISAVVMQLLVYLQICLKYYLTIIDAEYIYNEDYIIILFRLLLLEFMALLMPGGCLIESNLKVII